MRGEKRIETAPGNMWTKGVEKQKDGFIFTLEAEKGRRSFSVALYERGSFGNSLFTGGKKGKSSFYGSEGDL